MDTKSANDRLKELVAKAEQFTKLILVRSNTKLPEGKGSKRKSKQKASSKIDEEEMDQPSLEMHTKITEQPSSLRGTLQPHQMDSLNWMVSLFDLGLNGILADDMGLGKTIQSIAILAYLRQFKKSQGPHLIIAPKSTISNWMKEFGIWAPFFRIVNLIPTKEHRDQIIETQMKPGKFDICITTYEALNIMTTQLRKYEWKYVIFDEAHKLKNSESQISINSRLIPSKNRLLLTGTPLQNNLLELWSLLNFLMPQLFSSKDEFSELFDLEKTEQSKKMELIQSLHKVLRPFMLRRAKKDLKTKLPDKIEINIQVGLSEMQFKLYENLLSQNGIITSTKTSGKILNNLLMQLRKVCNHPYLFEGVEEAGAEEYGEHIVQNSGKLKFVSKLLAKIKAQGEQVLIFSGFTSMLNILEDFCIMRKYPYCRLDGTTELEVREQQINDFTSKGTDKMVFLISTRAGGLGINLMTANHVVLYDSDWNPQVDAQAMDRAHRIGQKKKVFVYRLLTKQTVEEKIVQRQAIKLKIDHMVIQQGRQAVSQSLSKDEYEKILLHGAAEIIQQKHKMLDEQDEDIDKLIEEGEKQFYRLQEETQKQVEQMEDTFDFTMTSVDCFAFQDKDFKEEKKKVQALLMEQQAQKYKEQSEMLMVRQRRNVAVPTTLDNDPEFFSRLKFTKEATEKVPKIKKDKFRVPNLYEFQLYSDFEEVKEMGQLIQDKIDKFEVLEEELKAKFNELLATGFPNWTLREYQAFIKSIKKRGFEDPMLISEDIDTKSAEEVELYMKQFLIRFRELKEKDIVLKKVNEQDYDQRNLQTIRDYDPAKGCVMLLQENHFFNRNNYLAMAEQAHFKLHQQNPDKKRDLQLKIDHFFSSQTQKMVQEQVKLIATAIRAEQVALQHLGLQNDRKQMRANIQRSKEFGKGYQQSMSARDGKLVREESKDAVSKENKQIRRVGEVDENLKFGRNKKTSVQLFKQ